MAVKVTNDALQRFGAAGYSRNNPLERMVRDARMFTIGGGTAQILRTVIASRILDRKLPQTRDGYLNLQRAGEECGPSPARGRGKKHVSSARSEEHTSELQSLMRRSYAGFCLKKKQQRKQTKQ